MAERVGKGLDMLVQNAINGLNAMPPRGGRADLSDEQVQAIVEYMIQ
jgi:cytochrome c